MNKGHKSEGQNRDNLTCPWCGHEYKYDSDLVPDDLYEEYEKDCEGCGQSFKYQCEAIIDFTATRVKGST